MAEIEAERELDRRNFLHVHYSVTLDRIAAAAERQLSTLDNPGFCLHCGVEAEGVEPDACRYPCEGCGAPAVYGAGELLIRLVG